MDVENYSKIKDIEPIYSLTYGLSQRIVIKYIDEILKSLPTFDEWIDSKIIQKYTFHDWNTSINLLHNPRNSDHLINNNIYRRRLAYDELLAHQLAISIIRNTNQKRKGLIFKAQNNLVNNFIKSLPFKLTEITIKCLGRY